MRVPNAWLSNKSVQIEKLTELVKLLVCLFLALENNVQWFVCIFLFAVDPTKIKRITRRRRYPEAEEYQRRLIQEQMQQTFDNLVAESQKNMEAVFLENSGNWVCLLIFIMELIWFKSSDIKTSCWTQSCSQLLSCFDVTVSWSSHFSYGKINKAFVRDGKNLEF